jgi:hypothetical protein
VPPRDGDGRNHVVPDARPAAVTGVPAVGVPPGTNAISCDSIVIPLHVPETGREKEPAATVVPPRDGGGGITSSLKRCFGLESKKS